MPQVSFRGRSFHQKTRLIPFFFKTQWEISQSQLDSGILLGLRMWKIVRWSCEFPSFLFFDSVGWLPWFFSLLGSVVTMWRCGNIVENRRHPWTIASIYLAPSLVCKPFSSFAFCLLSCVVTSTFFHKKCWWGTLFSILSLYIRAFSLSLYRTILLTVFLLVSFPPTGGQ